MRQPTAPPPQQVLDAVNQVGIRGKDCSAEALKFGCTLVTPMYGGGTEAGMVDLEMPIRASAIRGHLRFWWRLLFGLHKHHGELFGEEAAIWGGVGSDSAKASKVGIRVDGPPVQKIRDFVSSKDEQSPAIKYAFGSAAINGDAQWLKPEYAFDLVVNLSPKLNTTQREQVMTCLRWWASFGGLGARSRRGFGAIKVDGLDPVTGREVKHHGAVLALMNDVSQNPDVEWKKAVGCLQKFRQGSGFARTEGHPRPGRSFWPEPDQMRRFTKKDAFGKHSPVHPAGNVFPRAAFGLPITFDFRGSPGDPDKTELHPAGETDRMASPLILRPYWDGVQWRAAALLIPGWRNALSQKLKFKDKQFQPQLWPSDPAKQVELAGMIKPMKGSGTDPLSAFMAYFAEEAR